MNSPRTAWILVGISWLYLILSLGISTAVFKKPPFFVPTPVCRITVFLPSQLVTEPYQQFWCSIHKDSNHRLFFQNIWLFLAFGASTLYIPLIIWALGYVTPSNKDFWWKFTLHRKVERGDSIVAPLFVVYVHRSLKISQVTNVMPSCALAFALPVLPTSFSR